MLEAQGLLCVSIDLDTGLPDNNRPPFYSGCSASNTAYVYDNFVGRRALRFEKKIKSVHENTTRSHSVSLLPKTEREEGSSPADACRNTQVGSLLP